MQEHFRNSEHVRMGFLYMSRYEGLEGMAPFCEGLKRHAAALGKATLYSETITSAFLFLIIERLARTSQQDGRFPLGMNSSQPTATC